MDIDGLREYCLSIKEAREEMMFDNSILVYKVLGRWFAVISLQDVDLKICLKCDPDKAIDLRDEYRCVEPAWHFNKKYWNQIYLNRDMTDETVRYWIRHSAEQVVKKLSKKVQIEYFNDNDR